MCPALWYVVSTVGISSIKIGKLQQWCMKGGRVGVYLSRPLPWGAKVHKILDVLIGLILTNKKTTEHNKMPLSTIRPHCFCFWYFPPPQNLSTLETIPNPNDKNLQNLNCGSCGCHSKPEFDNDIAFCSLENLWTVQVSQFWSLLTTAHTITPPPRMAFW